jgi:hypothetical protein
MNVLRHNIKINFMIHTDQLQLLGQRSLRGFNLLNIYRKWDIEYIQNFDKKTTSKYAIWKTKDKEW